MADMFLFIQYGWKNIWKRYTIWLFSALPIFDQLFRAIQFKHEENWLWPFLYLTEETISIILIFICYIGVPYLVYCYSIRKPVTIHETLITVMKFSGRVIGLFFLSLLLFSPFFLLVVFISLKYSPQSPHIPNSLVIAFDMLSAFAALWQFSIAGFFINDWGIWQSIKEAWALFKNHFGILAMLGIILAVLLRSYNIASGIFTVLIQSGFNITSLSKLNYINPNTNLSNNLLFVLISGIGQIAYIPFSASVFILAYLKYSNAKVHPLMWRR